MLGSRPQNMDRLVFGSGPIALAETRRKHRRAFARLLTDLLGVEVVLVVASTYEELSSLVGRGEAQLVWLPPALFVRALDGGLVTLLLNGVRAQGSRFRGALYVRADATWRDEVELQGATVAWVDRDSCSGYLFPRLALSDRGIDPDMHFGPQLVLGSHDAVARAVAAGRADVGATFVDCFASGVERPGWSFEVEEDVMRTVLSSDPIPADTICAAPSMPPPLRARLDAALRCMHETPEGAAVLAGLFSVDRFDTADPADYAPVRRALSSVRPR